MEMTSTESPPTQQPETRVFESPASTADVFKKGICFRLTIGRPDLVKTVRLPQAKQAGLLSQEVSEKYYSMRKKTLSSSTFKEIENLDEAIRSFVRDSSMPSIVAKGIYVVPLPLVVAVDDEVQKYLLDRPVKVERFLANYLNDVEEAKKILGPDMWREKDYRTIDEMRMAFYVDMAWIDLGVPTVLQELSGETWARERARAQASFEKAGEEMRQVLRMAMADLVGHMVERLKEETDEEGHVKKRTFRDGMVTKFADFLNTVDFRNMTDDEELRRLTNQAKGLLFGVDDQLLRNTESVRSRVKDGMETIKAQLDTLVVNRPARAGDWD